MLNWLIRGSVRAGCSLAEASRLYPRLDRDSIFKAAAKRSNRQVLDDPLAEEPLARMLDSYINDVEMNSIGRIALSSRMSDLLCMRAWLRDREDRGELVPVESTAPPIIVTGFLRTGTTFSHRLLACAPDARWPEMCEVIFPVLDPKFSKAWESYSESLLLQNELDKSLEYIDKAISINSSIASHLSKKSLVLYYMEDYDASETFSDRALQIDENDVRALIVLGAVKTQKGLYDQSMEIFDLAIEIEPEDSSIYYWRGKNYVNMFDFETGMFELNKAIEMDRSQAAYYIERGQLFRILGNMEESKNDLLEAIEIAKTPRKQHLIDIAKELLLEIENE